MSSAMHFATLSLSVSPSKAIVTLTTHSPFTNYDSRTEVLSPVSHQFYHLCLPVLFAEWMLDEADVIVYTFQWHAECILLRPLMSSLFDLIR